MITSTSPNLVRMQWLRTMKATTAVLEHHLESGCDPERYAEHLRSVRHCADMIEIYQTIKPYVPFDQRV